MKVEGKREREKLGGGKERKGGRPGRQKCGDDEQQADAERVGQPVENSPAGYTAVHQLTNLLD